MKSRCAFLGWQVLPALLCFGGALALTQLGWLERRENITLDERTRARAALQPAAPPEDLVVIGIDQLSIVDFGRIEAIGAWPWPRDLHGDLLKLLGRVLPSVVTWDFLFTEPSEHAERDRLFADGIAASGATVVLGASATDLEEGLPPDAPAVRASRLKPLTRIVGDRSRMLGDVAMQLPTGTLAQVADIGFVDTPPDIDGVRRKAPLVVRIGDNVYPTLSLQSLMQHWGVQPDDVEVRLGDALVIDGAGVKRRIPIDENGRYWINYRHRLEDSGVRGYSELLFKLQQKFVENKTVRLPDLTGKILLVGQVAQGLSDLGPTPLSERTPLVLVHANVIANVLAEDYVRHVPVGWVWLGGFALGVAGLVRFSDRKLYEQAMFSLGVPIAYTAAATAAWIQGSWVLPLMGPVLGFTTLQIFMIVRRALSEQRAKEQIKGMFGTYLSPELVKRMVAAGEMPRLGGHEAEITAYFSDIQGFSTFSEKMAPDRLVDLMNEYLTACTDIVQEEGGTLDKYIGDAVVAMFGAPLPLPDHAYRACVATQRVQLQLAELRSKWSSEGDKWPDVVSRMQSRIGLNTGRCIIGNMGSRTRFNYTMMGDDVNLAARMESGAKRWGAFTMCTEATKLACEQHGGDRVVFRPLGRVVVKGRTRAVPIYEVVGLKESITPATADCVGLFGEALERYYARDWNGALEGFRRSAELEPNRPGKTSDVLSNPSLVYIEITAKFQAEPPPTEWDGIAIMKEK